MRRRLALVLLVVAVLANAEAPKLGPVLGLGREGWARMSYPQKVALVTGYMMATSAVVLAINKEYNVWIEDLMKYAVLNVSVPRLVEEIDRWYWEHPGEWLLFMLIGKLGSGRSTHGEGQDSEG